MYVTLFDYFAWSLQNAHDKRFNIMIMKEESDSK